MFSVAKADAVIQILPTALRFWEKLGLGPRGGKKDVTAFILFEGDGNERLEQADNWLGSISAAYGVRKILISKCYLHTDMHGRVSVSVNMLPEVAPVAPRMVLCLYGSIPFASLFVRFFVT
jgi:hypothetical protein